MSSEKPVYCRLLGGSIPASLCSQEQGQRGCKGCDAPSRRCEACGTRTSAHPKFGLCDPCLQAAVSKGLCENCHKAERLGAEKPFCSQCYTRFISTGEIEPSGTCGRTKPYEGLTGAALLAKVTAVVHPPPPPTLDPAVLRELPLLERILACAKVR